MKRLLQENLEKVLFLGDGKPDGISGRDNTGDVDLNKKLAQYEGFYNFNRPHGAHSGKTPYEALRTMLEKI